MSTEIIKIETDAGGDIVRYYCYETTLNNPQLKPIYIPYAYELMYGCDVSVTDGLEEIERTILVKLKNQFLPDASLCSTPQPFWFASIDARPFDVTVPRTCTNFNVSGTSCCVTVQGNMTFTPISSVKEDRMNDLLIEASKAVQSSNGTFGYEVMYVGAEVGAVVTTTGQDSLGAALNSDIPDLPRAEKDSEFTVLGSFVLVLMVLCVIGVIGFVVYQRRKSKQVSEYGFAVSKSEEDTDTFRDGDELQLKEENWIEPRRLPTRESMSVREPMETSVLNDEDPFDIQVQSIASQPFRETASLTGIVRATTPNERQASYRWDLEAEQEEEDNQNAPAMRYKHSNSGQRQTANQVAHQDPYSYSVGGIAIVPAYANEISDSSMSDVDSWAQTDGTVGSLDEP